MGSKTKASVVAVNGNLVTAAFEGVVIQGEVAFVVSGGLHLKSEVIRVEKNHAVVQVYEETRGVRVGDAVEFSGELLSISLGPGLLGQVFDGLGNPLPAIAKEYGYFLPRGVSISSLDDERPWDFTPVAKPGDEVSGGSVLGTVPENMVTHKIFVPFGMRGGYKVKSLVDKGSVTAKDAIAELEDDNGGVFEIFPRFEWPVRVPIKAYEQRLMPDEPLVTQIRIVDSFFPVAKGGSFCIPGPFGAGKTVLQQATARFADVDIVIIAACGERAGEVVETLLEFPRITDSRTGRSLMERTIIICNTSSMPVAARESSVYTAVTLAEYYRQMGLAVLLLADSTSRWAQAMREISGRLEEIPGEEAFPAYLESRIAGFYERAGRVRLYDGQIGSVTIGGTVSPAGGTFEEPVTQATLKVVGAFHGLSRGRSDARRYPAIAPLESWSNYTGILAPEKIAFARKLLRQGSAVEQMMKVVGEEGTAMDDYLAYLKAEFLDGVYLQQDAFDSVDGATSQQRQVKVFDFLLNILKTDFVFSDKAAALKFFHKLRSVFVDWNYTPQDSPRFEETAAKIEQRRLEFAAKEESS